VTENRLVIAGRLNIMDPMRHTPAGIPMLSGTLTHRSLQTEAGHSREVRCEIAVIAFAQAAEEMAGIGPDDKVEVTGFITHSRHASPLITLHAIQFRLMEKESYHA
jgi:primosomal replication protein N